MKKFFWLIIIILIGLQFYPVEKTNPPVDEKLELKANAEVKAVFKRACYDCHSNQTVWPWYSNIAPASILLADHVEEGRSELNFSEWRSYSRDKKMHKMEEIWEEIEEGEMPLKGYSVVHGIELTEEEKALIKDWSEKLVLF